MSLSIHGNLKDNTSPFDRKTTTPIVINGDMRIAQRGDQTGISSGQYINVDRFFINMINLGTWSFTQSTSTPDGLGFATSLKIDCTTADASPAAADNFYLSMQSEGQNLQILEKGTSDAQTSTVAYWIKSNKTGNYVVELWDRTNDRHVAVLKTISSADTWTKHICTFPADTSGALNNDSARSIMLSWAFDAGSNFTSGTLPSTWASRVDANRFVGTTLALGDNTANEVLITGVQWEVGTFADDNALPPFQFEDVGTSLARCQRYCIVYGTGEANYQQLGETGISTSTTQAQITFNHPTEMRGIPSLSNSGNLALGQGTSLIAMTAIAINTNNDTRQSTGVIATVASGLTAHKPYRIDQNNSSSSIVIFDAEL
jgi:hypothetical protein